MGSRGADFLLGGSEVVIDRSREKTVLGAKYYYCEGIIRVSCVRVSVSVCLIQSCVCLCFCLCCLVLCCVVLCWWCDFLCVCVSFGSVGFFSERAPPHPPWQ